MTLLSDADVDLESAGARDASRVPADWHEGFLSMLPEVERRARLAFRSLSTEARTEAVQDVVCNACLAYRRLAELGRARVATPVALAKYACAQYRAGRRVGCRMNAEDVSSDYCRIRSGVSLASLDASGSADGEPGWSAALVEDRSVTPADLAASRIDYPAWLDSLSDRDRKVAEALSAGSPARSVARLFGLSPARVSQLRRELKAAWDRFHGEAAGLDRLLAAT